MPEFKEQLTFEVKGAKEFNRDLKQTELSLRREAKALEDSAKSLQERVNAERKAIQPNKALISSLQAQTQALKLNATQLRAQSQALAAQQRTTAQAAAAYKNVGGAMGGVAAVATRLAPALAGLTAAFSVTELLKTADAYNVLQARIKNATYATNDYIGVSKELERISKSTGTSLEGNVELFQRLSLVRESLGASNAEVLKFLESVAKLGTISGASAEATAAGTMQLAQALSSGRVQAEEINSILENLPALAVRIEKGLGLMPGQLKNAVKEGRVFSRDILQAILKQTEDIDDEFSRMAKSLQRSLVTLDESFRPFISALDQALGLSSALAGMISGLGGIFDGLTGAIKGSALALGSFFKNNPGMLYGAKSLAPAMTGVLGAVGGPIGGLAGNLLTYQMTQPGFADNLISLGNSKGAVSNQRNNAASGYRPSGGSSSRGRGRSGGAGNAAREASQREVDALRSFQETLRNQMESTNLLFDQRLADMGAFASESEKLSVNIDRNASQTDILASATNRLQAISVKTKEGIKAKQDALRELTRETGQATIALKEYQNQENVIDFDRAKQIRDIKNQQSLIRQQGAIERIQAEMDTQAQIVENAYADQEITVKQYYDTQRDLIQHNANLELLAVDEKKAQLEAELVTLQDLSNQEERRLEIQNQIAEKEEEIKTIKARVTQAIARQNEEEKRKLQESSKRLGDSFEQSVSEAIQGALTGQGVGNALKQFAISLRNALASELANALASRIRKAFNSGFQSLGRIFNSVSGASGAGGSMASQGLTSAGPAVAASARAGSGGLAGIARFASAAAVPLTIAAASASQAIQSKGSLGMKYLRFIDPLGFRKLFGIDTGKKEKAQAARAAYQDNQLQPFLQSVVSGADPNNLIDLNARFLQAARGMKGRGERGMAMKQSAMAEIRNLIQQRQMTIDQAIREFSTQNRRLQVEVNAIGKATYETFKAYRDLQMTELETETAQLLAQFKDSEDAKTQILRMQSLKRLELQKQEQMAARENLLEIKDLLQEREDVLNANVFQRRRSAEQIKSERLQGIETALSERYMLAREYDSLGIQPLAAAGINQLLAGVRNGPSAATLTVNINGATDPNMVYEQVARAFENFNRKMYGANVA